MIAVILPRWHSKPLKASLDYALHDRDGINTERVGEVWTLNLVSNPYHAHKEMQVTVDAAKAIQARARAERGERSGSSGSRVEKPTFHFALSWHPDDRPTPDQMRAAARSALDRLGMSELQAVIVQHKDELHAHLHVIVNTVSPETGRARSLFRNGYVLDRWAYEYEQKAMTIRTWNRAAKYAREHEWGKKKEPEQTKAPQWERWKKGMEDLQVRRQAEVKQIKERQADRREAIDRKLADIRRHADIARQAAKERHDEQIREYWKRDAPKMKLEPRPTIHKQLMSEGAVMADAIKQLRPVVYPGKVFVERRQAQEERRRQDVPIGKKPDERDQPKPEFQDRAPPTDRNRIRALGIEDRYDGELAIKRFQRHEMSEIDRVRDEAIIEIRKELDRAKETNAQEWREHKARFDRLHEDLRRECNIPDKQRQPEKADQGIQYDRFGNEVIDMSGPVEPEQPSRDDVKSYVDDYIAGRGRDSQEHEQFAANHAAEIEQEFQRRAAELHQASAPPLEPDPPSYVREFEHERHEVEPDWDREIGD